MKTITKDTRTKEELAAEIKTPKSETSQAVAFALLVQQLGLGGAQAELVQPTEALDEK